MERAGGMHVTSHLKRLDLQLGFGFLCVAGVTWCLIWVPSPRPCTGFASVCAILSVVIVADSFFGSVLWEGAFRRTSGSTGGTKPCNQYKTVSIYLPEHFNSSYSYLGGVKRSHL